MRLGNRGRPAGRAEKRYRLSSLPLVGGHTRLIEHGDSTPAGGVPRCPEGVPSKSSETGTKALPEESSAQEQEQRIHGC